ILGYKDSDGQPLIDKILDTTGQKGTGRWTVISAAELGEPLTLIAEAMFARSLSALKDQRVEASKILKGPSETHKPEDVSKWTAMVKQALYCSKVISYAQGFMLLKTAS